MTTSPNELTWDCDECYGSLAIEGVEMSRLAWCLDMTPLWGTPDVRGDNTLVPALGYVAEPYYLSQTMYSPLLVVNGHWDRDGVALAGGATNQQLAAQLEANLAWLFTNVVLTGTDTQTAVWTLPSGGTVTAEVQVLGIPTPTLLPGAIYRSTLDIRVPGGDLHL